MEDIMLKLSEERNGLRLANPVVRVVAKYLVEVALVDDASLVNAEDILSLAREAWAYGYVAIPLRLPPR